MNVEKLAMIEKAKCIFSPYEIATPSVINTVNLMADFALEQTTELRAEVERLQKALDASNKYWMENRPMN